MPYYSKFDRKTLFANRLKLIYGTKLQKKTMHKIFYVFLTKIPLKSSFHSNSSFCVIL